MLKQDKLTVVRAFSKEYRKGRKKGKTLLLTKLIKITGYSRKHKKQRIRRHRISRYLSILKPLKKLWAVGNYASGQRLVPMIPIYLYALKRHERWTVTKEEKKLLFSISFSTVNRLLKHERRRINLKGRSRTKPGSLLKNQIPIRTFSDWTEKKPGFSEIDTVHHCGGDPMMFSPVGMNAGPLWANPKGTLSKGWRLSETGCRFRFLVLILIPEENL